MAKHLKFRKLRVSDWRDMYEYGQDSEVTKYLRWGPYKDPSEPKMYIRLLKAQKGHVFAVVVYGKMVGTATMFEPDKNNKRIEIGYVLNKDYWGMGIGYQALMQIIRFATAWYKGYTLYAEVHPKNEASINLLKKGGFKKTKKDNKYINYEMDIR